ncbi:hypothetical protein [Salipaludibacillus agaradhaerens]|uniref:hypothetical protein n=1 Tax=Salipaludibacillus agaradhaerens TaxID=76935 RepID=UPI0009977250|nr:hypothetical protein [Salipaludibacillus agaradhaerens]
MRLKFMIIHMMLLMVIMGGCDVNVPDTRAFQDEFTSEFMQSTTETEEGYYTFESGTGGYTMLFPTNARIGDGTYYKPANEYERYSVANQKEEKNITSGIRITYENNPSMENIDINLSVLSMKAGYEGEYETFELEGNVYNYASYVYETLNGIENHYFISFIKSENSTQGIMFIYSASCLDSGEECEIDVGYEEEVAKKIMTSIEFKDGD